MLFPSVVVGTGRDLSGNDVDRVGTGRDLSNDNVDRVGTGRDLSDADDNRDGTGRDLSLPGAYMILNEYGKIADRQWYWLAEQYPYVVLHEFIVMPNHMHGIIEINTAITGRDLTNNDGRVGTGRDLSNNVDDRRDGTGRDLSNNVDDRRDGTGRDLSNSVDDRRNGTGCDLSLSKIKSVSELIGAYKMTVSKKIHESDYAAFAWQRSFHDHIIRNEESYEKISNYIINNPNSWDQDKFFKM